MVKNVKIFVSVLAAAALSAVCAQSNTNWYTGSPDADVFEISTADELRGLSYLVNNAIIPVTFSGKSIVLTRDVDLEDSSFTPIGNNSAGNSFLGAFDGNGHTISGLYVELQSDESNVYAGLFGYVGAGGQLKNVNIVATKISASASSAAAPKPAAVSAYAGGLAAYYGSALPIENCSVRADTIAAASSDSGSAFAGGLVGRAGARLGIYGCHAGALVSAGAPVAAATTGGIDTSLAYSGGLLGYALRAIVIDGSTADDSVASSGSAGGLLGHANDSARIENSNAGASVSGRLSGGLLGHANAPASIAKSHTGGNISGCYSGGLLGRVKSTTTIANSYTNGNVWGEFYSGGLTGGSEITAVAFKISNCYASGEVTAEAGTGLAGGVFGRYHHNGLSSITSTHYNADSAITAAGAVCNAANDCGSAAIPGTLGQTSANLKKRETFTGWDFDEVWEIAGGYPYLKASADIKIEPVPDQIFTGTQIRPEPTVKTIYGATLVKEAEYVISYGININAGEGTVAIFGVGRYGGLRRTVTFAILPKALTEANLGPAIEPQAFTGSPVTPPVTLKDGLKTLAENKDYTVSYTNNTAVGIAAAAVTGTGNYTGKLSVNFTIFRKPPPTPNTGWYTSNSGASVFRISTDDELAGLAQLVNNGNSFSGKMILLNNDIDLSRYGRNTDFNDGKGWNPIGTEVSGGMRPFSGIFDGNGKTVSRLQIGNDGAKNHWGLFGSVSGGEIRNLGVADADIRAGSAYFVGIVAGFAGGKVTNCYSTGTVNGHSGVGGVAGYVFSGNMSNCYSTAAVEGNSYIGGVVGYIDRSAVANCAALNPSVFGAGTNIGRLTGHDTLGTMTNNAAFSGMTGNHNNTTGIGANLSASAINADGTLGGRFAEDSGWTTQKGKLPGLGGKTVNMPAHLYSGISIASNDRVIPPPNNPNAETSAIAPVNRLTGEFTAGPNPVGKTGTVHFYRQGKWIDNGALTIYDASGNAIRKISIRDDANRRGGVNTPPTVATTQPRRQIGSWDLTDAKGKSVPKGTYLARGAVTAADGKKEKVSIVICVR